MARYAGAGGELHDCASCGGQFVDHCMLEGLIEQRRARAVSARPSRSNPLAEPVRYRRCPMCDAMMNRRNYGNTSGIIVDVCGEHGVWFDPGELPRVLAFVEAGGSWRLPERSLPPGRPLTSTLPPLRGEPTPAARAGDFTDAFIELVAALLGPRKAGR